jgi:hypothetical protein
MEKDLIRIIWSEELSDFAEYDNPHKKIKGKLRIVRGSKVLTKEPPKEEIKKYLPKKNIGHYSIGERYTEPEQYILQFYEQKN